VLSFYVTWTEFKIEDFFSNMEMLSSSLTRNLESLNFMQSEFKDVFSRQVKEKSTDSYYCIVVPTLKWASEEYSN
jgi:hypothetical protein